jgi:hypothetical protein
MRTYASFGTRKRIGYEHHCSPERASYVYDVMYATDVPREMNRAGGVAGPRVVGLLRSRLKLRSFYDPGVRPWTYTAVPTGAQPKNQAASALVRLVQPALCGVPKLPCQYVPWIP